MSELRRFIGFISAFALLLFVATGSAEAGPYANVKVKLDADASAGTAFADRTNGNTTTRALASAGDTVMIEAYLDEAADTGADWLALTVFSFDNTGSVFTNNFTPDTLLLDPDIPAGTKLLSMKDDGVTILGFATFPFKANKLIGTLVLVAKQDIAEGTTIKLAAVSIATGNPFLGTAAEDSLDASEASITFQTPTGPKLEPIDPDGMMISEPKMIPRGGRSDTITVTASEFAATDTISWVVSSSGNADVTVLDADGMMMEEMMFMTPGMTSIKLYASGSGSATVSVYAYVGTDTTSTLMIEFSEENPVELASFGGELAKDRVLLTWTTASQTNNAGWRMLRSVDGETYEVISEFIPGAGTSDALLNYSFSDKEPPSSEKVFYVLEQVDLDGTVHRSNAVEVILGGRFQDVPTEFATNVYPNPFNPSTTVSYDLPSDALVSIVIYDVIGQEVRRLVSEQKIAGRYHVQWDARDNLGRSVGSGVYIAKVEAGSFSASQKMLLLK